MSIFSDMVGGIIEVFMDDFSIVGNSFDHCLDHLNKVLKRCKDCNLVPNWEKCHVMVKEGIVWGHGISSKGIEFDKAKVEVIEILTPPISIKGVRTFEELKKKLVFATIIIDPNLGESFDVRCDSSGVALQLVLGQRYEKILNAIYYASKALTATKKLHGYRARASCSGVCF
ncbi:uncharacterized protein LOC107022163 [Solanum pennellii]|uniref:Uncharacterized protein LOC107022163 n=1 Tax=Solanum pennellii TaxID=28526 RepID=A0ABM1GZV7_SOLPN|nr:uncharacterized protein LOC107022163 [Solanum pennellii]